MYLLRTSHRSLFCVITESQLWYVVDAVPSEFVVFETGSVCVALGCPGTYCVDQAGLQLRDWAFAS